MNSSLETFVPLQFKRKKGKLLVDGRESAHDVHIIEAVARAMYWHALLDSGTFKRLRRLTCSSAHSKVAALSFCEPDVVPTEPM